MTFASLTAGSARIFFQVAGEMRLDDEASLRAVAGNIHDRLETSGRSTRAWSCQKLLTKSCHPGGSCRPRKPIPPPPADAVRPAPGDDCPPERSVMEFNFNA